MFTCGPSLLAPGLAPINTAYTWTGLSGSGVSITGTKNQTISWPTYTSGSAVYARTPTALTGKKYCEFKCTAAPGEMYVAFGVQATPIDIFYNKPGSMLSRMNNTSGCGLPASGYTNGSTVTSAAYVFAVNNVIGVAFDATTRNIWFRKNGNWIAGDPSAGTGASITLGAGTFYFTMGLYSCTISNVLTTVNIMPNAGTQVYAPPSGFSRYQP